MKVRYLAVSSTPAMPMTRERGNRETAMESWVIPSTGLATTIRMQSGECSTT